MFASTAIKRLLGVLFVLLLAQQAIAQTVSATTGAINGTVSDATKAVLPGATVTLSGPTVMGTPTSITDQNGVFRFAALQPGEYKLTFELAGFGTVTREGIHVSLGFTATVNIDMNPGSLSETVTVSGASPVVDLQNTNVTTHFDADKLASLPGSRDFWAVVAQAPAVAMSRMDVGGSGALTQQPYTAYGLASNAGVNRGMVEGMMVNEGGGGGGSDMYYTDYGAFAEVAVNAVGNTAEMPNPGVLSQLIAKSGGNAYHGTLYADFENDSMEARNIDAAQLARGVSGSDVVAAVDTNRLSTFKDFNVDSGGFLMKDKLWWYAAYRRTVTDQRYPTLVDDIQHTWVPVGTGKITANLAQNHKFIAFFQHADKNQPDYLGSLFITPQGRTTPAIMHADTTWESHFPTNVYKAEYNAVLTNSLLLEVRAGTYHSVWWRVGKSTAPRVEDVASNFVSGGMYSTNLIRNRPQVNGSVSYSKSGWVGSHNFKFGGEIMRDTLVQPFYGFKSACNCVSVFNANAPSQVYLYQNTISKNGLWTDALYANDTWQVAKRLTLNLGIRWDRQQPFLPQQEGPGAQSFDAVDSVLVWNNNWGPRFGISYDLTGDGKTLVKSSYGQFWLYPAADFATNVNANPPTWYRQYAWTDLNGNGSWNPGEEGRLLSVLGGTAATRLDPDLQNTFTRQTTVYAEREVAPNFGVRTGFVWNGRRQVRAQINVNRPLSAYNVPVTFPDPGPDGRLGTADDGATLTGFNLAADVLALPIANITTNLPDLTSSDYYTWEITATRRGTDRWSLLASFAETWSHETNLAGGANFTPNQMINTDNARNRFKTWQGKINATLNLRWDVRVTPIYRHQSGTPFGRTFVRTMNYGNATILAEPFDAGRTPNINIFDVRTEKSVRLSRGVRVAGFFDVYNIFNTNAEQALAVASGSSFLRPVAITPPRLARIGAKLEW